jgi:hypothetical protein
MGASVPLHCLAGDDVDVAKRGPSPRCTGQQLVNLVAGQGSICDQSIGDQFDLRLGVNHQSLGGSAQPMQMSAERDRREVWFEVTSRYSQIDFVATVGDRPAEQFLGGRTSQTDDAQVFDGEIAGALKASPHEMRLPVLDRRRVFLGRGLKASTERSELHLA